MSSVWALLSDILAPARSKGLSPSDGSGADFVNALVQVGFCCVYRWSLWLLLADCSLGIGPPPAQAQSPYSASS